MDRGIRSHGNHGDVCEQKGCIHLYSAPRKELSAMYKERRCALHGGRDEDTPVLQVPRHIGFLEAEAIRPPSVSYHGTVVTGTTAAAEAPHQPHGPHGDRHLLPRPTGLPHRPPVVGGVARAGAVGLCSPANTGLYATYGQRGKRGVSRTVCCRRYGSLAEFT